VSTGTNLGKIAIFCSGLIIGVAAIVFLGGGKELPPAKAADTKPTSEIGRFQVFRCELLRGDCLLDTATGKVWFFQNIKGNDKGWAPVAEGPK
jgi:hypothetical protein